MSVRNANFEDMAVAANIMVTSFRTAFADFVSRSTMDACTNSDNCRAMLESIYQEGKTHWIVDDEAAAVVRQIFAWCMEGYGPSQIAHKLKAAKVDCPTVHWAKMGRNAPA